MSTESGETIRKDIDLLHQQLRQAKNGKGVLSQRSQKNIRKALRCLSGIEHARPLALKSWRRCLRISPQVFVLFSASIGADTINRKGSFNIDRLILVLKERRDSLDCQHVLSLLVVQYALHSLTDTVNAVQPGPARSIANASQLSKCRIRLDYAEQLLRCLQSDSAFQAHLPSSLVTGLLAPLCSTGDAVKRLWEEHTTGLPLSTPALACWHGRVPTFAQLWEALSRVSIKDLRIFSRGEQCGQASAAFCQLATPDPENPTYIVGMESSSLTRHFAFGSCAQLQTNITTFHEDRMVFNLTPKYSFVDLHIDYGMDGISAPLHDCSKIWFLYPPTPRNLSLMAQERGQHAKFARMAANLEGGIITQTTSAEALYIPSGCLHAVFTTNGGFLVSIDCTARSSVWPFSEYLRSQLQLTLDPLGQKDCYFLFLKSLEVSLANSREFLAMRSWTNIEDDLRELASSDTEWKDTAASLWRRYDSLVTEELHPCPCSGTSDVRLIHKFQQHTQWLFAEERRPRRTRGTANEHK